MEVKLFPNSQLGPDEDVLEQARSGAPVAVVVDGGRLAVYQKELGILGAPYLASGYDGIRKVVTSPLFWDWADALNKSAGPADPVLQLVAGRAAIVDRQAGQHARRSGRCAHAHARRAGLDRHHQGDGRHADADGLDRCLFGAADEHDRRGRGAASRRLRLQALRGHQEPDLHAPHQPDHRPGHQRAAGSTGLPDDMQKMLQGRGAQGRRRRLLRHAGLARPDRGRPEGQGHDGRAYRRRRRSRRPPRASTTSSATAISTSKWNRCWATRRGLAPRPAGTQLSPGRPGSCVMPKRLAQIEYATGGADPGRHRAFWSSSPPSCASSTIR